MVNKQSLGSSSQQGETIEVRHRAMASCKESSTFPLLIMEEFIKVEFAQDTLTGVHIGLLQRLPLLR